MSSAVRTIVGVICASYYRMRSHGRIAGGPFLMRKTSLLRLSPGSMTKIGRGVSIDKDARIVVQSRLAIGEGAYVGKNSTIVAFDVVEIGANVLIGENVSIHSEDHGPAGDRDHFSAAPVAIEHDVWIGAGVVITKGVTIGAGSTIGANSVVTRDIPPNVLAVGAPARVIRDLQERGRLTRWGDEHRDEQRGQLD